VGMNFSTKIKNVLSVILILIGVSLLGNTNNNPIAFIERIFKPVIIGGGTFYYSSIFPILLIYFGFKWMNKFGEYKLLKTRDRRILATIIILLFSNQLITYGIKISKSMSTDLNSIYYNRNNVNNTLSLKLDNKSKKNMTCTIELENCSKKAQEFYIKIHIPEYYKEYITQEYLIAKESDFKTDKKFILHAKEKRVMEAVFLGDMKGFDSSFDGSTNEFEFLLIKGKEEVKFIKKQ
jgi:hypothetical protein